MDLTINADRFEGKKNVEVYDQFRPTPPVALVQLVQQYLNGDVNHLVDIGCGSGLSTIVWKDIAKKITAVEPSEDMLNAAKMKFKNDPDFQGIKAFGHDIPLDDQCADILTCSQAFHWMDPQPTLEEINRLLKDQGLLVIYDCIWPPSIHPIWEQAFVELFDHVKAVSELQPKPLMHFWNKQDHIKNVEQSSFFKYMKQVGFDKIVKGGSEYFIGLAESQGGLQALKKIGMSDEEIGWNKFKCTIRENPMPTNSFFVLHYSAIFAIK